MISLYPHSLNDESASQDDFFRDFTDLIGEQVYPFSSARAALVFGLRAIGLNRLDEILVPPFLSHCVLSAVSRTAFPTMAPTDLTRAILVFHQFGFPQNIERIQETADQKGWLIINDCAQTLFSKTGEEYAAWLGDLSVFSLAKFFPILMGGAMTSRHPDVDRALKSGYAEKCKEHASRANVARAELERAHHMPPGDDQTFLVESVFGYLPEIVAFPSNSLEGLPLDEEDILADSDRRQRLWEMASNRFPTLVPDAIGQEIVPFAIPIRGDRAVLDGLSAALVEKLGVEAPVLNFDFAMDMLEPDYRPALVLGCHVKWTEEVMTEALDLVKAALS